MPYQILLVEADGKIAASIQSYLTRYGYQVAVVRDFDRVLQEFAELTPHLVVPDVNLPYQDGFHLCRELRRRSAAPILFLSARAGELEQVLGIESGGDDYVAKPFEMAVLHARVKALLRRAYGEYAQADPAPRPLQQVGDLQLDLAAAQMHWRGQAQPRTRTEVRLLHLLMDRAGQVVSRDECLTALWQDASFVDDNTLTFNVNRLRAKLEAWGLKDAIETRRGLGYRLAPERLLADDVDLEALANLPPAPTEEGALFRALADKLYRLAVAQQQRHQDAHLWCARWSSAAASSSCGRGSCRRCWPGPKAPAGGC